MHRLPAAATLRLPRARMARGAGHGGTAMTDTTTTAVTGAPAATHDPQRRLWRFAGWLALTHVVLILVGIGLQNGPRFDEGVEGIRRGYAEGNLARIMTGGIIEGFGFVLLVPVLVFLARVVGRRTEAGRWAAQSGLVAGAGYVVVTMAVGFPAGAAALYGAQHGLDLDAAFAVNNVRIFGYFLSLALLGAHALGLAIAALQDGLMRRWLGVGGLITGTLLFSSVPAAAIGQQDWGTLVWLIWWVGVAVCLLRHRPSPAGASDIVRGRQ